MVLPIRNLHVRKNRSVIERARKLANAAAVLLYDRAGVVCAGELPTVRLIAHAERSVGGELITRMQNRSADQTDALPDIRFPVACAALEARRLFAAQYVTVFHILARHIRRRFHDGCFDLCARIRRQDGFNKRVTIKSFSGNVVRILDRIGILVVRNGSIDRRNVKRFGKRLDHVS